MFSLQLPKGLGDDYIKVLKEMKETKIITIGTDNSPKNIHADSIHPTNLNVPIVIEFTGDMPNVAPTIPDFMDIPISTLQFNCGEQQILQTFIQKTKEEELQLTTNSSSKMEGIDTENLHLLKIVKLKELCKNYGLSTSGTKETLVKRLQGVKSQKVEMV